MRFAYVRFFSFFKRKRLRTARGYTKNASSKHSKPANGVFTHPRPSADGWPVLPVSTPRDILTQRKIALGCAEWSGKRCIQSLKVLRREGYRKRHSVFLDVRWRAGFGNCDNASAAYHPGQRDRGGRATMDSADLRQRAVTYYEVIVAAERRVRHDRQVVLLAPRQDIAFNATVVETVWDLIGGAAMAVWNAEQIFHLANVEIGYAPSANLPRRT